MKTLQERIRPSADLRNHYNEISKQCRENNEETQEYTESYVEGVLQENIEQRIGYGREEENLRLIKETVGKAHQSL